MKKKLIYIADDEINICNIIKSFLVKAGYEVESFNDGASILEAFYNKPADMLIIDIMMPEMDGYSLCSSIRGISNIPIIIVSAKDSEPDKIAGLTLGCDDYLTKPFSPLELIARIKSLFRRIEFERDHKNNQANLHSIRILDIEIFPDTKQVQCNGTIIHFTVMEFNLLLYLIKNKNTAISRDELLNKIWGFDDDVETRATDDMIMRVRKKLSDAKSTLKIETVWGFGFRILDNGGD
jgi:DNA-binding response OmpR family regulator